jgi:hypothetical protein
LIPRLAGGELFIFIMCLRTGEDDDDDDDDEKRRLRVHGVRSGMPAGRTPFRVFRLLRLGERELDLLLDIFFDLLFGERELDIFFDLLFGECELDIFFDLLFGERELDLFLFVFFLAPPAVLELASRPRAA